MRSATAARLVLIAARNVALRHAGDVEGHDFHGNQWTKGGGKVDDAAAKAEHEHAAALAAANTNPLAHPQFVLGADHMYQRQAMNYVAAYGREFETMPRPDDVEQGKLGECYRNASLHVMTHPELTYAEGFAKTDGTGDFTFMHAWAVTKDNKVIDPTFKDGHSYFGVKYDRATYLKHLYKAKYYGILGSTDKVVKQAVDTGMPHMRTLGDKAGHDFHGNQWTGPSAANDAPSNFDFASQARQFPAKGKPGVTASKEAIDVKHSVDVLLHRNEQGKANAVLYHYPQGFPGMQAKGSVNVLVDPSAQRQGIATKLMHEGLRRYKFDLTKQEYTKQGRQFITSYVKKLRTAGDVEGHPFHGNQWTGGTGVADDPAAKRAEAAKQYADLRKRWTEVNDKLFRHVDNPTSAEAWALIQEQKQIVKEGYRLDADPGGLEGISLPGGPRDVVVIGAGPGGLAASTMAGAEGLDTLLIEKNLSVGGQSRVSSRIENLPGFPVGVTGEGLAASMETQSQRMGAEHLMGVSVTGLSHDPVTGLKTVTLSDGTTVEARSVVVAGGVEFERAHFPGADSPNMFYGDSRSLAAAGAGKNVVVAGGSNGAAQAALLAAQKAERVTVISRKPIDESMSEYQVQAMRHNPKIEVLEGENIVRYEGGNIHTAGGKVIPSDAVGVFFGGKPKTEWLPAGIARVQSGKIHVNDALETSMPGVYAVGDMRHGSIGRIGASIGDGQLALHGVFQYFDKMKSVKGAFGRRR